jgi:hypothetical protein
VGSGGRVAMCVSTVCSVSSRCSCKLEPLYSGVSRCSSSKAVTCKPGTGVRMAACIIQLRLLVACGLNTSGRLHLQGRSVVSTMFGDEVGCCGGHGRLCSLVCISLLLLISCVRACCVCNAGVPAYVWRLKWWSLISAVRGRQRLLLCAYTELQSGGFAKPQAVRYAVLSQRRSKEPE